MVPLQRLNAGYTPSNAKQVRLEFMNYLANEGQVFWQHSFVL